MANSFFSPKTWVDRISEYPTRRKLTATNGTVSTVTVERSEGTVSQAGDAFSATNMNALEQRINSAFDSVNSDLTDNPTTFSNGEVLHRIANIRILEFPSNYTYHKFNSLTIPSGDRPPTNRTFTFTDVYYIGTASIRADGVCFANYINSYGNSSSSTSSISAYNGAMPSMVWTI